MSNERATSKNVALSGWSRPLEEIQALVRKAETGDAGALAEVRAMLTLPGAGAALGGDLARQTIKRLVGAYSKGNPVIEECVNRTLDQMRAELGGTKPTPVERLLVDRVLACWVHLHHIEGDYAVRVSMPVPLALYYQKALSAAQRRYLAALKALAEVRKLALPAIQVNVARRQVNIAAGAGASPG